MADPEPRERPRTEDYSGLQVVETPGLELAEPRPDLSFNKTYEEPSGLPEAVSPATQPSYDPSYDPYKQHQTGYAVGSVAGADAGAGAGGGWPPNSPSYGPMSPDNYYGGANPYERQIPDKPPKDRICGLRKIWFWVIVAIVVFVVVVGIAIGVGVGIGARAASSSHPAAPSNNTSPTPPPTTTVLPAAVATATAGTDVSIKCPAANRTLYTLPQNSSRKFLMLCGRDYNSDQGAVDMYNINVTTFSGCLNACGNQQGCTAVGWGSYFGTNTCWLKSAIGDPNWSISWYAAVEDDSG